MLTREQISEWRRDGIQLHHKGDLEMLCDQAEAAIELRDACQASANYFEHNGGAIAAAILHRCQIALAKLEAKPTADADTTHKGR